MNLVDEKIKATFAVEFVNKLIENNKDIKPITKIYDDVIEEYIKLHKIFNFTNPVEMYAMFNYAYKGGYLSKNQIFNYGTTDIFRNGNVFDDILLIDGVNIINGTGVCRHISAMFKDILKKCNIENMVLPVYMKDFEKKVKLMNYLVSNHIINVVKQNGLYYFLDPTNQYMYKLLGKNNLANEKCELIICHLLINLFNKESYFSINQGSNIMDLDECNKLEVNTYKICESNIDIFEKFYSENKDKYSEISDKIKVLKKHKLSLVLLCMIINFF